MFDRRHFFAGLGGLAASLAEKPLLGHGVEVDHCIKEACKTTACTDEGAELNYGAPPKDGEFADALKRLKTHFRIGLLTHATEEDADAFLTKEKDLLKLCYEDELEAKVKSNSFTQENGKELWYILNDQAYILGQLTASMVKRKKASLDEWEPVSKRSFLRAKSNFAVATSTAHCKCFTRAGAYKLPRNRPHAKELDKDCCLC